VSAQRAGGAPESPATLLVADSDAARADQLRAALETAGYRVIPAADGAAALRLLSAHASELVLCQAELSDMDGFDVCRAIKQAPATRTTPVILLVDEDDGDRERARQAGADEVIARPVDPALLPAVIRAHLQVRRLNLELNELEALVYTLARAVEDRDHSSLGLAEKVAHWAIQLGTALSLPNDQLTELYKAALLHDVGSVGVPVAVLSKPAHLDPSEFDAVKRHPLVGEEILRALPGADQLLPAVRHHHERIDGAGYPDGLHGDAIPLFARIIAIADAFVALTNDRPYRRRRSKDEAIGVLQQGAGKQWDAGLVERFLPLVAHTDGEAVSTARAG
jgi:putative two-component system response regulator